MPTKELTEKIANRLWCKTCNDWSLFSKPFTEEETGLKCDKCGIEHQQTLLSEIPEDKLKEQQKRFKEKRSQKLLEAFNYMQYLGENPKATPPLLEGYDRILEADAGILAIEKMEKEQKEAAIKAAKEDIEKHKHLGRNDVCICGTGKKYKKCCLSRIEGYYKK